MNIYIDKDQNHSSQRWPHCLTLYFQGLNTFPRLAANIKIGRCEFTFPKIEAFICILRLIEIGKFIISCCCCFWCYSSCRLSLLLFGEENLFFPQATAATDTQTENPLLRVGDWDLGKGFSHLTRCQLQSSSNPGGDFVQQGEVGERFPEGKMFLH